MANWSTRAGYIGLLGFFVMGIGYILHDGTWSTHLDVDEGECSRVLAVPAFYGSEEINACNSYLICNIMIWAGWIMFIGGLIGYFTLPAGARKPAEKKPGKKAEAKPEKKGAVVVLLCPKCGARNEEDAEFCKKCGKRLRPKK